MELYSLTRKRETHPSVVNVCVHSLLVTLRIDGVGVPAPDGAMRRLGFVPREGVWLTARFRSNTAERWAVLQRLAVGITVDTYTCTVDTPRHPARTSSF